jgi:hypothetical protein
MSGARYPIDPFKEKKKKKKEKNGKKKEKRHTAPFQLGVFIIQMLHLQRSHPCPLSAIPCIITLIHGYPLLRRRD